MAKGVEDCAFYRFTRLGTLTEVGADPDELAVDAAELHRRNTVRQAAWPAAMTTLTTHDTKRGEDTRARTAARARSPTSGPRRCAGSRAGPSRRPPVGAAGVAGPHRHVAGVARPPPRVCREGGPRGRNVNPVDRRRPRVRGPPGRRGGRGVRRRRGAAPWSTSSSRRRASPDGATASASSSSQLTAPGVPDVYQGSELWETSLVDPDNRRPVDFAETPGAARPRPRWRAPRADTPCAEPGHANCSSPPGALPCVRNSPDCSPRTARSRSSARLRTTSWRSIAVVRSRSSPACSVGLKRRDGWGDTTIVAPRRRLARSADGTRSPRRWPCRSTTCSADHPVALLIRVPSGEV